MRFSERQLSRFWKKVNKSSSCWLWVGGGFQSGYGLWRVNGFTMRAHRVSWMIHFGDIPDGLCVCRRCDTPKCVRPDRLWLGTSQDNTKDKMSKGRHRFQFGQNHYAAKLNDSDVQDIRLAAKAGRGSQIRLARAFKVSKSLISAIVLSKRRKQYTPPAAPEMEGITP